MSQIRASLVHTIAAHQGDVNGVSLSTKILASCSGDKTVRLWNLENYSELSASPLRGHKYLVHCCEFSPFGTTLATCSTDGKVILWDMKTFEQQATFQHPSNQCIRVCKFSSNSCLLVTGGDDMTLCLWDINSKALLKSFEGHDNAVVAVAFSPDTSYIVSGSKNGDLRVWDARFDQKSYLYLDLHGHDLGVTCCAFSPRSIEPSPDDRATCHLMVSSGYDNNVRLWTLVDSLRNGVSLRPLRVLVGHGAAVFSCAFSTDGSLIASVSGDKTIILWNPDSGDCFFQTTGHSRYVTCCAFSPSGLYLATGSNDKTVAVWQLLAQHEREPPPILGSQIVDLSDDVNYTDQKQWLTWSVDQVSTWLTSVGMGQYDETFRQNAIDGQELDTLNDELLNKSMKIAALGHRNKILRAIKNLATLPALPTPTLLLNNNTAANEAGIPHEYICPITCEVMIDPVIVADGYTYERTAIKSWLYKGKTLSPMTNAPLANQTLTPNRSLKTAIQRHLQEKN